MKAAHFPEQRPPQAKLLAIDSDRHITHMPRNQFARLLRPGDLVIANDASTFPASLAGTHVRSGDAIEVRLAGRSSLRSDDVKRFTAVVFGAGDFRTSTEARPLPPQLVDGDCLHLGPLVATVERLLDHPRLVTLQFNGTSASIWSGLAQHGRPIQYAYIQQPLQLWDVWAPFASMPAAFEPPSAGFSIDWNMLAAIRASNADFATITHAAGISSTGDPQLDKLLPLPEPYIIPPTTAAKIHQTSMRGGRVIAVGTTVVRALEHAAIGYGQVRAGESVATQRIGATTVLRIVHAILSGTHEAGTSHFELLRAFLDDVSLYRVAKELEDFGYLTHEFGDSVLIEHATRTTGKRTADPRC